MCTYYYKGQATLYSITEDGQVYNNKTKKFLKGTIAKDGYKKVHLTGENLNKTVFVHRMVLETFDPIENSDKMQVNHKDGNKLNNNLDNLEWVTGKENMEHAWSHDLCKNHTEVYCYDRNKKYIGSFYSIASAAQALNIHRTSIAHGLQNFPQTKVKGYYFSFAYVGEIIDSNVENDNSLMYKTCKPVAKCEKGTENIIETYASIREAASLNNVRIRSISDCCNNKTKSCRGYNWIFI